MELVFLIPQSIKYFQILISSNSRLSSFKSWIRWISSKFEKSSDSKIILEFLHVNLIATLYKLMKLSCWRILTISFGCQSDWFLSKVSGLT